MCLEAPVGAEPDLFIRPIYRTMDEVPVTLDDLRSLCSDNPAERVDVRCRQCNYTVTYKHNRIDTLKSEFKCTSPAWECMCTWTWHRLMIQEPKAIGHWFYVVPPKVDGEVWELTLVEDLHQKKAYHSMKLRGASRWPERLSRLEVLRAVARFGH